MEADNDKSATPRSFEASEIRTNRLRLIEELAESSEATIITKKGRSASCPIPYPAKRKTPVGRDRGKVRILATLRR